MKNKPFAAAAEQNRDAILSVLKTEFANCSHILEIGSGTGQHAAFFSEQLTHLRWQASDKKPKLAGINQWLDDNQSSHTPKAIELDVVHSRWPKKTFDGAFAANIAHIMHWFEIEAMFTGLNKALTPAAKFCLYGPFNINGEFTSESNQRFDLWLKKQDPNSGLRDKCDLDQLAIKNNLQACKSWQMPANNLILSWQKF